jgi:hypothetical protein
VKAHIVIESVLSKQSSCKITTWEGLPSLILAARNGPNFTALHLPRQSETASMKSWSSFA